MGRRTLLRPGGGSYPGWTKVGPYVNDGQCSVEGCDRHRKARGYCSAHYQRIQRKGSIEENNPLQKRGKEPKICSVDGCKRPAKARGLCDAHYNRWYTSGHRDPDLLSPIRKQERKFWKRPKHAYCKAKKCGKPYYAKGYCIAHYKRLQRHGDARPLVPIGGN
ncbi:hypothetical protein LCGC14_1493370 [marine sediment metagenome]|uniref:Vegetative protein n=1 Tax=marine sediment metagenome TaxID=412755 RepID=A0A0F9J6Q7_9ZZZZ